MIVCLEEVDEAVAGNLDAMLDNGNYDLFYGTLGIGLYFLKKKKDPPGREDPLSSFGKMQIRKKVK